MSVALDVGTSRLRSLRRSGRELVGRGVPAAFGLVPDGRPIRDLLTRAGLPFAEGDGELLLIGQAAVGESVALNTLPLRLFADGLVPTDDPPARQVLATLVESLLPADPAGDEPCGLVLPAAAVADRSSREFLVRLVRLRGFEPVVLSSGQAVALATLGEDGFTGLAVSLGAGGCEMSLVHLGQELTHAVESRGTDRMDDHLAASEKLYAYAPTGERYLDAEAARRKREGLSDPLTKPTTPFAEQVAELYADLIGGLARSLAGKTRSGRVGSFSGPLPVVCHGGGTRPAGFATLVQRELASAGLPISLGPVRLAPPDDYLVARGGLIAAELESAAAAAA